MKLHLNNKQKNALFNTFEKSIYCENYDTFDINNACYCMEDSINDIIDNINNANRNITYINWEDIKEDKQIEIEEDIIENLNSYYHYNLIDKVNNIEISTNIYKWLFDIENETLEIFNWEYKYFIDILKEIIENDEIDDEDIETLIEIIEIIEKHYKDI